MLQQKRLVHGGEDIKRPEMRKGLFFNSVNQEKERKAKTHG